MPGVKQTPNGAIYSGDTEHNVRYGELEVCLLPGGTVRVKAQHFGCETVHMTYGEWAFLVGAVHRLSCSLCGKLREECEHTEEDRRGQGPYLPTIGR